MFGCRHLNPDLRLKPCLVVVICDHQISAYTRFSSIVYVVQVVQKDQYNRSQTHTGKRDWPAATCPLLVDTAEPGGMILLIWQTQTCNLWLLISTVFLPAISQMVNGMVRYMALAIGWGLFFYLQAKILPFYAVLDFQSIGPLGRCFL